MLFFFHCSLLFYGYSKNLCRHKRGTKSQIDSLLGLSEGNARGVNSASFFAFSHKTQFHYSACVKCTRMRRMNPRAHGFSLLIWDIRENNSMAFTLDIHAKSHTVRGRPTLKLVERFRNGSVRELYERSIYERSSIEKYQAKHAISNELSHIMFTC